MPEPFADCPADRRSPVTQSEYNEGQVKDGGISVWDDKVRDGINSLPNENHQKV